jgi:hypothetical protein
LNCWRARAALVARAVWRAGVLHLRLFALDGFLLRRREALEMLTQARDIRNVNH